VPCEEDWRHCDVNVDVPSCNGTGWTCSNYNCQYNISNDRNFNFSDNVNRTRLEELVDFLSDHLVATKSEGTGHVHDWHFCSEASPCTEGGGDCDSDAECAGDLICGSNSCANFNLFAYPGTDCCIRPILDGACTAEMPCDKGQGTCLNDDECRQDLICGTENCMKNDTASCCTITRNATFADALNMSRINETFNNSEEENEDTQEKMFLLRWMIFEMTNRSKKEEVIFSNESSLRSGGKPWYLNFPDWQKGKSWIKLAHEEFRSKNAGVEMSLKDFILPGSHHPGMIRGHSKFVGAVNNDLARGALRAGICIVSGVALFIPVVGELLTYSACFASIRYGDFVLAQSVTQEMNIVDQLNSGVRYMDVRIRERDGELFSAHGDNQWATSIGLSFPTLLQDVKKWLDSNDGEFLVWSLRWEIGDPEWDNALRLLRNNIGALDMFYWSDETKPREILYKNLKDRILILPKSNGGLAGWRSKLKWSKSWDKIGNVADPYTLMLRLDKYTKNSDNEISHNKFNVIEAVLTPDPNSAQFWKAIGGSSSLIEWAKDMNNEWLYDFVYKETTNEIPFDKLFQVIMIDAVEQKGVMWKIICYNIKC